LIRFRSPIRFYDSGPGSRPNPIRRAVLVNLACLMGLMVLTGMLASANAEGVLGAEPGVITTGIRGNEATISAAPFCADAGEIGFLRGLNQDRQYPLAAYQAEIDRRRPGCSATAELDLELAKALYQLGEFARVRSILRPRLGEPVAAHRRYWAEAHLLDYDHSGELDSLSAALESSPVPVSGEDADIMRASAKFLHGDVPGALSAWPVPGANPECPDRGEPLCYLRAGNLSPAFAAGLSMVPGAGYAYAGRIGDGVFAFTVVSLFYGVAAYYANYGSPARAWTFAGFGAVFHASNIVGARRAAQAGNRLRKTGFLIALHRRWFP
jgi:hypothetical protein